MTSEIPAELIEAFRTSMSRLAAGVTVVAAVSDGQMHGMVATTPTSVSIDPPTLLVCLDKLSRTYQVVQASRRFCVSLLAVDQSDVFETFAGRREGIADDERFNHLDYRLTSHGMPLIEHSIAWIDCEVEAVYPGGNSHGIFVGRVVEVGNDRPDAEPMVWYGRAAGTYQVR